MIHIGDAQAAQARRRELPLPGKGSYFKSEYIDSPVTDPVRMGPACTVGGRTDPESFAPVAFLVEQSPLSIVPSHFHQLDEFQVMVGGSGFLGRNVIDPLVVHFAGGHTGYGPISAGPSGVAYFTMRPRYEAGAFMLPESRPHMKRLPKRHLRCGPIRPRDAAARHDGAPAATELLVPEEADGIGVAVLRLPPHGTGTNPFAGSGNGQYWMTIAGTLVMGDATLERWSVVFASGADTATPIIAGADGLDLIVMQYPHTLYADRAEH